VSAPEISVIIPTRNESGNIKELVRRLGRALGDTTAELLFVDDSDDDTPSVIDGVAKGAPVDVRCLHRSPGDRAGGLGSAVLAGFRAARGRVAVVMDGDLQHPPEEVPALANEIDRSSADIVVASRYANGHRPSGLANRLRVMVSTGSTRAAKAIFPRRLRAVTDPMSGFFAVDINAIAIDKLDPIGFKILIETIIRSDSPTVTEIDFTFADRYSGTSKAGFREGLRFLWQLLRLRFGTLGDARTRRALAFALVGASGIIVNTMALWLFSSVGGLNYLVGAVLATQVSTTANFVGNEVFVFRGLKRGTRLHRFVPFAIMNNVVNLLRLPLLSLLVSGWGIPTLIANVLTLLAVFAVRFSISDRFIYSAGEVMPIPSTSERIGPVNVTTAVRARPARSKHHAPGEPDVGPFAHLYDVHGILTVGSDGLLPELEFFRVPALPGPSPDIAIRKGKVGRPRLRSRLTRHTEHPGVQWEEHFGRLSANFSIDFGDQIQVTATRGLLASPHVLYTNVVEALLRFVFVDRGYMLLHSACLDMDGQGLMLSARTDTGKTGTILTLLRDTPGTFLSDDMTIIDGAGVALAFPKPLTISHHTLRAVNAGRLTPAEWRKLRLQSRLHSKEGRGFAMMLAEHNVPIMSINSWVQRVVPPPKYEVKRLVPCELTKKTHLTSLFIIERGEPHHSLVPQNQAIEELLENTEDAYGFPPYRYLAPAIALGDSDYEELRGKERLILASAIESAQIHRLGSNDFSWSKHIPDLVGSPLEHAETAQANGNGKGSPLEHAEANGNGNGSPLEHAETAQANGNGNGQAAAPEVHAQRAADTPKSNGANPGPILLPDT